MQSSLTAQISREIYRTGLLMTKMSEIDSNIGTDFFKRREAIIDAKTSAQLSLHTWKRILDEGLDDAVASLSPVTDLDTLLEYHHVSQVSHSEWQTLKQHQEHLRVPARYQNNRISEHDRWLLPCALQAARMELPFDEALELVFAKMSAYITDKPYRNDLANHSFTVKAIELIVSHGVNVSFLQPLNRECLERTADEAGMFDLLVDILAIYGESIVSLADFHAFLDGIRLLGKHLDTGRMNELAQKYGQEFLPNIMEVGHRIRTDLTDKAVHQLFHKEGAMVDGLLHPYGPFVEKHLQAIELARGINDGRMRHSLRMSSYDMRIIRAEKVAKLLQYAALTRKKAFIRLVEEDHIDLTTIDPDAMLLNPPFYEAVNLNTLNAASLIRVAGKTMGPTSFKPVSGTVTVQEYEFLHDASDLHQDLFHQMTAFKVDERLRLLGTLPAVDFKKDYQISYGEFKDRLLQAIKEDKEFRHYPALMVPQRISRKGALLLHLMKKDWAPVLDEIATDQDIEFLMCHELQKGESLLDMKARLYKDIPLVVQFTAFLETSDAFLASNRDQFFRFYERGMMKAVMKLRGVLSNKQENNLRLLAKAEISGKLKDIKYRDEDFENEIGFSPDAQQRAQWKQDTEKQVGPLRFYESSDFADLMNMGRRPLSTCQDWENGSYRHALLSVFDLNKKLLLVEKQGVVIARALIRLTKIKTKPSEQRSELRFLDVEQENLAPQPISVPQQPEKMVLFLERLYNSDNEQKKIEQAVIAFAEEKAKAMGIDLLTATSYKSKKSFQEPLQVPMYISRSKNGSQYLDSLGGNAGEELGGKFRTASVYQ